jgi:hypothetical protein
MATPNPITTMFRVFNCRAPGENEGPRAISFTLDFSAAASYTFDLEKEAAADVIGLIQTIMVDNWDNPSPAIITLSGLPHRIVVPPNTYLVAPAFAADAALRITGASAGGVAINVALLNVPVAPMSYNSTDAGNSVSPRGTWTDRSGTIAAGGASQQLMAANATRKAWMVENPSSEVESLWLQFGGAAVTDQPSLEIVPGGSYKENMGGGLTTQQVQVIATTTGHKFIAREML